MKVLIAVDGSEHADKAIAWYFTNMHKEGNEVVIFNHAEIPAIPHTWLGGMPMLTHEEIERMVAEHKKKCNELKAQLKEKCTQYGEGTSVSVVSEDGGPGHNIIKKAKAVEANMIITGTRGLGKFSRTILGSVSDYLVHHSNVPVLVCHL